MMHKNTSHMEVQVLPKRTTHSKKIREKKNMKTSILLVPHPFFVSSHQTFSPASSRLEPQLERQFGRQVSHIWRICGGG